MLDEVISTPAPIPSRALRAERDQKPPELRAAD
jgi:hypothetical protein